jgi:hypothetical protein
MKMNLGCGQEERRDDERQPVDSKPSHREIGENFQ